MFAPYNLMFKLLFQLNKLESFGLFVCHYMACAALIIDKEDNSSCLQIHLFKHIFTLVAQVDF